MKQNPSYEDLRQKVTDLEGRVREDENRGAEQHIQEVTKRLEKIAEMGDDGIIVFDEEYRSEVANAVASENHGYAKERLIGMDFRRLLSERDIGYLDQMHSKVGIDESKRVCTEMEVMTEKGMKWDAEVCITIAQGGKGGVKTYAYLRDITQRKRMEREIREATKRFEKMAEMGQKVCMEMGIKTPQGLVKETEVCIAPTQSEDGQIKTYAYIRDITERKKFERELKESEEKFRNLFERVRHGLFISSKEGKFIDCNQALLEMVGYEDKEEFLNIDIAKDLYVNQEDRRKFQRLTEAQGFVKALEVESKKRTGEKITVLLTANVKRDEKGRVIGYEGLNIDISERKRMERELKEANEFLTNLIESSVGGVIVNDSGGEHFT